MSENRCFEDRTGWLSFALITRCLSPYSLLAQIHTTPCLEQVKSERVDLCKGDTIDSVETKAKSKSLGWSCGGSGARHLCQYRAAATHLLSQEVETGATAGEQTWHSPASQASQTSKHHVQRETSSPKE